MSSNDHPSGSDPMDVDSNNAPTSPSDGSLKRPASAISSSPTASPTSAPLTREKMAERVSLFFEQLTRGCGRKECSNACASNPNFPRVPNPNAAAQQALQLAMVSSSVICTRLETIDYKTIENLIQSAEASNNFTPAIRKLGVLFSSSESVTHSFWKLRASLANNEQTTILPGIEFPYVLCTENDSAIDYDDMQKTYSLLMKHENLKNPVINNLSPLLSSLRVQAKDLKSPLNLRQFVIALHNPLVREADFKELLFPLTVCISALPDSSQQILVKWLSSYSTTQLRALLSTIQDFLTARAYTSNSYYLNSDSGIVSGVKVMKLIYEANKNLESPIQYSEFYNDPVNDRVDINQDFKLWKTTSFSFCRYPFLLDARTKSGILQRESEEQMLLRHREAFARTFMTGIVRFAYLDLEIHRERLIQDTIDQLSRYDEDDDLKMTLKVHFVGEEAVDEGGPQKEFFQLIVREIFDVKYGMFIHDEENKIYWFNSNSRDFSEFELIGKILGIAIYNGVILDVHFPFVVYKRLKGIKPTFQDLMETFSSLGKGLKQLLEYEGDDIEDIFGMNFQVRKEVFGEVIVHDLKPNGDQIPVTKENRTEFVQLYTEYLLETSVAEQFHAFLRGFNQVVSGPAFDLFNPEELQLLVCGSPELDFTELEKSTKYENGYSESHQTIKDFWEVVHSMTLEQKKKLLTFATGSDRAPIGGLSDLHLVILRHGPDSDRLPQAHTCFNYLLLPEYSSKEKLRERLTTAINNAEGFGMR